MSHGQDKKVSEVAQPVQQPAGKVEVDSRGNSVWRWARDVLESTSVLLKRLENKDLALEPTRKVPVIRDEQTPTDVAGQGSRKGRVDAKAGHPAMQRERRRDGGGFDPYNSR